ncbi:MAG: SDR family oxidoreductase [Patescibacteria group bacterium]
MKTTKTVLIVGGNGGIGASTVNLFAAKGWMVYYTYYKNKKTDFENKFPNTIGISCDVTKNQDIKKVAKKIKEDGFSVDAVIYSVTTHLTLQPFEDIPIKVFEEDIEIILIGAIRIFQVLIPLMKKEAQSVIIPIITSSVISTPKRMSSYVIAKFGLLGLVKSLAVEISQLGIRVVGLSPSFVETSLLKAFPAKMLELEKSKLQNGKFISPEEIAKVLDSIICDKEKFLTGENIIVNNSQDVARLIEENK